jgi:hypothetical protein
LMGRVEQGAIRTRAYEGGGVAMGRIPIRHFAPLQITILDGATEWG